jgi:hypothetical protein
VASLSAIRLIKEATMIFFPFVTLGDLKYLAPIILGIFGDLREWPWS